ncbi:Gpi16 subunit, GPI transamidase component protein [Cardiosporidium cionae]|uniref:Gpi16 subunit, GPI transamidase component protein n=1 Tax=Cardiosporidium cionae TaxID=476202 RepID=A0ABQ7JE54_9APIC|nr:Gpi16 subunit, GPI transamidase component protein [Cardiosporidium cionae]|eukprot:KAF8822297.1 Gpi16 subunit, GPI transamidase component protein [Cardiosporidium cionae]
MILAKREPILFTVSCGIFANALIISVLAYSFTVENNQNENYSEGLFFQTLKNGNQFLAHMRFTLRSTNVAGAHHYFFPKEIGKILDLLPIRSVTLISSQGRWNSYYWGEPPMEVPPSGSFIMADIEENYLNHTWTQLLAILDGLSCIPLDSLSDLYSSSRLPRDDFDSMGGTRYQTLYSSLPHETFCLENLSKWRKFFPCGKDVGILSLVDTQELMKSPYKSLGFTAKTVFTKTGNPAFVELVLQLSVVLSLPKIGSAPYSLKTLFHSSKPFIDCPLVTSSNCHFKVPHSLDHNEHTRRHRLDENGDILTGNCSAIGEEFLVYWGKGLPYIASSKPHSRIELQKQELGSVYNMNPSQNLQAGFLLRFTNHDSLNSKTIRYHDYFPPYLKPLLHTFSAEYRHAKSFHHEKCHDKVLFGEDALQDLQIKWGFTDGKKVSSTFSLRTEIPPQCFLLVRFDMIKAFIPSNRFSFDVNLGKSLKSGILLSTPNQGDFLWPSLFSFLIPSSHKNVTSNALFQDDFLMKEELAIFTDDWWTWQFPSELLIAIPVPDFSMTYNIMAFIGILLTFFFASIFRAATG